jgi:hypothetical protein
MALCGHIFPLVIIRGVIMGGSGTKNRIECPHLLFPTVLLILQSSNQSIMKTIIICFLSMLLSLNCFTQRISEVGMNRNGAIKYIKNNFKDCNLKKDKNASFKDGITESVFYNCGGVGITLFFIGESCAFSLISYENTKDTYDMTVNNLNNLMTKVENDIWKFTDMMQGTEIYVKLHLSKDKSIIFLIKCPKEVMNQVNDLLIDTLN